MQRRFWLPRIFLLVIFTAGGIAGLVGGIVIGHGRFVSLLLIVLGAALLVVAAVSLVAAVIVRRRGAHQLSPSQQRGLVAYLKVSRYVRAALEAALGVACVITGIVVLIAGGPYSALILGFGCLLCLLAGANVWIARRLAPGPGPDDGQAAGPGPEHSG